MRSWKENTAYIYLATENVEKQLDLNVRILTFEDTSNMNVLLMLYHYRKENPKSGGWSKQQAIKSKLLTFSKIKNWGNLPVNFP